MITTTTKHSEKFLCFRKWNFLASSFENSHFFLNKKNSYISRANFKSLKKISYIFSKKDVFFTLTTYLNASKKLENNSLYLFYNLNLSILLIKKYIESLFLYSITANCFFDFSFFKYFSLYTDLLSIFFHNVANFFSNFSIFV